jgi:signal transduction histidine kinase/ActR/RegA family two-component response regulator
MRRNRIIPGSSGLKAQIIIGFSLTILAVGIAGYIAFNSTRQLIDSLVTLTQPNPKLDRLEEALRNATMAENSIRLYSITHNNRDFVAYTSSIQHVDANLKVLKKLFSDDKDQRNLLRNVSKLLNKKMRNIRAFIEFKKGRDSLMDASMNWDQIAQSTADSIRLKLRTRTYSVTTYDTIVSKKAAAVNKEVVKRNLFNRLLGKKKKVEPEPKLLPRVLAKTRVITDSSYTAIRDTTYIGRLKRVYQVNRQKQIDWDAELTHRETQLIKMNGKMISSLMELIGLLKRSEQVRQEAGAIAASEIGNRAIVIISIVAGLALLTVIVFTIFIFHGIRKNTLLNKQLVIAKQEAEHLASVKEEFLANMSHEIRTPLNAIIGFSDRLSQTHLVPKQHEFITAVQKSSDFLLATVNDILDFSKIEAGKLRIDSIPFEPAAIVAEIANTMQLQAEKKKLSLTIDTSSIEGLVVLGDPMRLKQILFNLTNNGIKFTESGFVKIIVSRVEETEPVLKFQVADTGIGIEADKQELIFEAFSQADASSTRRFSGTGLGLAICKKLVELQNGTITVESMEGEGSLFTVIIPYLLAPEQQILLEQKAAYAPNLSKLANKYLLLVDDDEYNLQLTRMMLEEWGLHFDEVRNGFDAMEMILRNNYDLVLTDIHMPEVSGLQLTRYIRSIEDKHKSATPVIAFTANVMKDDLENYMKSGVNDFLLKPFTRDQVLEKIMSVFEMEEDIEIAMGKVTVLPDPDECKEIKALKRFTGDDEASLRIVIQSFLENGEMNLKLLNDFFKENALKEVGEVAHKMLTPFSQLGDNPVVPILMKLERLIDLEVLPEEQNDLITSLNNECSNVFKILKEAAV